MYTAEFYEALGHLLFAVANTNSTMSLLEQKRINDMIHEEWAEVITEELESTTVLFHTVRKLALQRAVWRPCFKVFEEYYTENEAVFTEPLKEKILQNAESIVLASKKKMAQKTILQLTRLFWD